MFGFKWMLVRRAVVRKTSDFGKFWTVGKNEKNAGQTNWTPGCCGDPLRDSHTQQEATRRHAHLNSVLEQAPASTAVVDLFPVLKWQRRWSLQKNPTDIFAALTSSRQI